MSKIKPYIKIILLVLLVVLLIAIGWFGWMSYRSSSITKAFYSQYSQCVTTQDANCFKILAADYPQLANLIIDAANNIIVPEDDNFRKLSLNLFSKSYLIPLQNFSFSTHGIGIKSVQLVLSGYTPIVDQKSLSQGQAALVSQIFGNQIFKTGQLVQAIFTLQYNKGQMVLTNYFVK